MKKKALSILLALVLAVAVAACGPAEPSAGSDSAGSAPGTFVFWDKSEYV